MSGVDPSTLNIEHKLMDSFFTPPKPLTQEQIDWAEELGLAITVKEDGRVRVFGGDEDEREEAILKMCDPNADLTIKKEEEEKKEEEKDESESDSADILFNLGKEAVPVDENTMTPEEQAAQREKELEEYRNQQQTNKFIRQPKAQPQPAPAPQKKEYRKAPQKPRPVFNNVIVKPTGWGDVTVKPIAQPEPEPQPEPEKEQKKEFTHTRGGRGQAYNALHYIMDDSRVGPSAHDRNYDHKNQGFPQPRKFNKQKFNKQGDGDNQQQQDQVDFNAHDNTDPMRGEGKKRKRNKNKKDKKQQQQNGEQQEQQQEQQPNENKPKKDKKNKNKDKDNKFKPYIPGDNQEQKQEPVQAPAPAPEPPKPEPVKEQPKQEYKPPKPKPLTIEKPKQQQPKARPTKSKFGVGNIEITEETPLEDLVPDCFVKPKVIEPELRRSFYFAFEWYTDEITDDEIRSDPRFHMELRNEKSLKPHIAAIRNVTVAPIIADFVAECFSATLAPEMQGLAGKFSKEPTAHRLLLPSMIPVSFTLADGNVVMAFFDTPSVCGVEAESMVKAALDTFATRMVSVYEFKNVKKGVVKRSEVIELGKRTGTVALISRQVGENNVVSFKIYVMHTRWDDEKQSMVDAAVKEWFAKSILCRCALCKQPYHEDDGSSCEEKYHPGERIPFEDGEMEQIVREKGVEVVKVNYSCCDICSKDDPGCKIKVNPAHEKLEVMSTIEGFNDKILV
ncbi:hypothetical protein TVAG_236250 [Trichomonas vaginalis G3]|uniref:Uncharacterized protein n=1 Tax=Trichomonas vaginalis (strain ATCC PRA-98 / G3) TaxID=412133 RepID=A2G338_TRIV3|nr:structural constituent of cuticle [Trichomonas vaginalis G3]EAX88434.1 hypothetical protein TVAG_236250 [Trichomonas vaginalis G3]KAI5551836.1 structural constituent of cuticle [Trichomonas vaginalis G3]|eukprot:XP_001301364.1 hypothetical protein [Trichomonas vaginalis G3]